MAACRGLLLSSRSELQQVLERRKRVQSEQEDEGPSRTPLEDVLLQRQQKHLQVSEVLPLWFVCILHDTEVLLFCL